MPEDLQLWKGFNGHGLYAKRAERDRNGEEIVATYAKKTDVPALTDSLTTSETTAVTPGAVKSAIDNIVHIPDTANQPSTLYVGGQGMGWAGWETEDVDVPVEGAVIGGRVYKTVTIGTQTWLGENLDYLFKVNNAQISLNPSGLPSTPACWYNDFGNAATYGNDGTYKCGLLYNWHAVEYLENNKATLIPGWHVPTDDEWATMITYLGGNSKAGSLIKAPDKSVTSDWPSDWRASSEPCGFNALPCGYYYNTFSSFGTSSRVWTGTATSWANAKFRNILKTGISWGENTRTSGYSVRLVKD